MSEVAVFWDYESARVWAAGIQVPLADRLMDLVRQYGPARILKVYSKWIGADDPIVQGLYSMGFQPIYAAMGKKNSVDVMFAVDCIACCWERPEIGLYVLVSGDKDYISVVNYLKTQGKKVVVVGPAKASSEHLQLSATEFFSFEDLASNGTEFASDEVSSEPTEEALLDFTISYDDAVDCLHRAISNVREDGKPTRYEVVDPLMRTDSECKYRGYVSIEGSSGTRFRSFGHFIKTVSEESKVVIGTTGVFNELFLPGEDPEVESAYAPASQEILPEHWKIVLNEVERAFEEGNPGQYLYGRFMMLYNYTRSKKREGELPLTNNTIKDALSTIVTEGLLVRQEDESYRLVENYGEKKDAFLKKMGAV
jgi:uncharacterized protein (TIGR00288 family)